MKRFILYVLCLLMVFSACLAEETPVKANRYKAAMFKSIPEKTMKKIFSEYMAPDYKAEYQENDAWCPDLVMCGEGCYNFFEVIEDNERIRACREIAENLFRTVYPGSEPELSSAMSFQDYLLREIQSESSMELKDGQWCYMGKPITHELEGALGPFGRQRAIEREKIENTDPSWTILQYRPGPVDGLSAGMYIFPSERYLNNYACVTTFIFDGENRIIAACMGGSFTAKPVSDTEIHISKEEALRIAREYFAKEKAEHESRYYNSFANMVGDTCDYVLKELGYSSIHAEGILDEDSGRLVLFMNDKWQLLPAWEFHEAFQVIADGRVIQDHYWDNLNFCYISAEDGTAGLESVIR